MLSVAVVAAHAQVRAVVGSIGSNRTLNMEGIVSDVSLSVMSVASQRFNTIDEVNKIKDFVYNELSKEFPFTLLPESDVLSNEKFQDFVKTENANGLATAAKFSADREVPEGYLTYLMNPAGAIECFPDVNAVMEIHVNCTLTTKSSIGNNGSAIAK
ncbi:MAG: hypothetical protein LBN37_00595, partial [Bacteroidales bacterium]|nr:hypothetical protein [Bacteroidales bacterium]